MITKYRHYISTDIVKPSNAVKIILIGAGGNGAPTITGLARINTALKALGHPGIHLSVIDGDTVGYENIGRQLYSKADIGRKKAECLVTRVNMFFELSWDAYPCTLDKKYIKSIIDYNPQLIITAVDNVKTRKIVYNHIIKNRQIYYLDMGNTKNSGQVILGVGSPIPQPKKIPNCIDYLPTIFDLYPDLHKKEKDKDQGPSCGIIQALEKQDLFINTAISTFALDLLWKAFRKGYIEYHGAYINLETFKTTPLLINPKVQRNRNK